MNEYGQNLNCMYVCICLCEHCKHLKKLKLPSSNYLCDCETVLVCECSFDLLLLPFECPRHFFFPYINYYRLKKKIASIKLFKFRIKREPFLWTLCESLALYGRAVGISKSRPDCFYLWLFESKFSLCFIVLVHSFFLVKFFSSCLRI